jgi:hypothetical protein
LASFRSRFPKISPYINVGDQSISTLCNKFDSLPFFVLNNAKSRFCQNSNIVGGCTPCCFGSDFLGNHTLMSPGFVFVKRPISSKAKMHDLKTCKMRENEAGRPPSPSRMFVSKSNAMVLHEKFQPLIEERTVLWITYFVASYARSYLSLCQKQVVFVIFAVCGVHLSLTFFDVQQQTVSTMVLCPVLPKVALRKHVCKSSSRLRGLEE